MHAVVSAAERAAVCGGRSRAEMQHQRHVLAGRCRSTDPERRQCPARTGTPSRAGRPAQARSLPRRCRVAPLPIVRTAARRKGWCCPGRSRRARPVRHPTTATCRPRTACAAMLASDNATALLPVEHRRQTLVANIGARWRTEYFAVPVDRDVAQRRHQRDLTRLVSWSWNCSFSSHTIERVAQR